MAYNGSAIKANPGASSLLWFQTRMPECSSALLLPSEPPEHSKWQESSSLKQCILQAWKGPWLGDSSTQERISFYHLLQRQLETWAETAILRQSLLQSTCNTNGQGKGWNGEGKMQRSDCKMGFNPRPASEDMIQSTSIQKVSWPNPLIS